MTKILKFGVVLVSLMQMILSAPVDKLEYGMILDAGSSSTKITLYSWPSEKRQGTPEVTERGYCKVKGGGLAGIAPDGMEAYLAECLKKFNDDVAKEGATGAGKEALLGGTAGMRMLQESNPEQASKIVEAVKSTLRKAGWTYKDPYVAVISGDVEGLSAWITVNYLKKAVFTKGDVKSTFGALDLGGASTQIAFEVEDSVKGANVYPVTLFGNKFNVYSQSYSCHGMQQAFLRYRALLILNSGKSEGDLTIESPCESIARTETVKGSEFGAGCTKFLKNADKLKAITFKGTSDINKCQETVAKLVGYEDCSTKNLGHCLNPSEIPSGLKEHKFYSFSAYKYTAETLQIKAEKTKLSEFLEGLKKLCVSGEELKKLPGFNDKTEKYFKLGCFDGHYVLFLLEKAYKFSTEEDWNRLWFLHELEGTKLGWSLGYLIKATSADKR